MKMKKIRKTSLIFEFSISKLRYMEFSWKFKKKMKRKSYFTTSLFNFDCLMKMAKKKEDEKFRKMNLNFEFSMSKLGYVTIFIKTWEENNMTHFLRHFWPIAAKMKMLMEIFWKMSLIFEFSISKLCYADIFKKIWE